VLPTLAELCNVPVSSPLDGVSFVKQIRQPETDSGLPVFAEYNLRNPQAKYMIRDGSYKFTLWTHDMAELYDLRTDPQEMNNLALAPGHAKTVARLQEKLFAWYRPSEL
jgi:choline-sulfatase